MFYYVAVILFVHFCNNNVAAYKSNVSFIIEGKHPDVNMNIILPDLKDYTEILYNLNKAIVKNTKIFYFEYDPMIKKDRFLDGLFTFNYTINKYSTYSHVYKFDRYQPYVAIKTNNLVCNYDKCEFGLVILYQNVLDDCYDFSLDGPIFESAVLILLKPERNYISFGIFYTRQHANFLTSCPYKNYVHPMSQLKYIINDDLVTKGVESPSIFDDHIFIPFHSRNDGDKFFQCGILKQPSLPDLKVGYEIDNDLPETLRISGDPITHFKIQLDECDADFSQKGWFHILKKNLHYNGKTDVMRLHKNNSDLVSIKYYFDLTKVTAKSFSVDEKRFYGLLPDCVLIGEFYKTHMFPVIGSLNRIRQKDYENTFYQVIDEIDYDKTLFFSCQVQKYTDVFNPEGPKQQNGKVYNVLKNNGKPIKGHRIVNKIRFIKDDLEPYGKYVCASEDSINFGKVDNEYQQRNVHLIPKNNSIFIIKSNEMPKHELYEFKCLKNIQDVGTLEDGELRNGKKVIHVKKTLDNTFESYKPEAPLDKLDCNLRYNITVICKYKSVMGSTFSTIQNIKIDLKS
uniref:6-cysteine protein n=1 Tax=Parastrongyloides trichosuri TaxID=131310 RepID=A0A0N5A2X5_PARTI